MVKMKFNFLVLCCFILLCAGCSKALRICNQCKKHTYTQDRLIGDVDMEICDNCYDAYLNGEWGSIFSSD